MPSRIKPANDVPEIVSDHIFSSGYYESEGAIRWIVVDAKETRELIAHAASIPTFDERDGEDGDDVGLLTDEDEAELLADELAHDPYLQAANENKMG